MRVIKLFLLSVIVFGLLIFFISLLFPGTTYVSKAMNMAGDKSSLRAKLPALCRNGFELAGLQNEYVQSPGSDTVLFKNEFHEGGMAVYELSGDSSVIQVYYKIRVPWYQPWNKFVLMVNEEKYGPPLDSALSRIRASVSE